MRRVVRWDCTALLLTSEELGALSQVQPRSPLEGGNGGWLSELPDSLAELGASLKGLQSPEAFGRVVVEYTADITGADSGCFLHSRGDRPEFVVGVRMTEFLGRDVRDEKANLPLWTHFRNRASLPHSQRVAWKSTCAQNIGSALALSTMRQYLAAPLAFSDGYLGFLYLERSIKTGPFRESDLDLLAQIIALAPTMLQEP